MKRAITPLIVFVAFPAVAFVLAYGGPSNCDEFSVDAGGVVAAFLALIALGAWLHRGWPTVEARRKVIRLGLFVVFPALVLLVVPLLSEPPYLDCFHFDLGDVVGFLLELAWLVAVVAYIGKALWRRWRR